MISHNGSEAGRKFAEAFMQAEREMRAKEQQIVNEYLAKGCKLVYPWDGWFRLERNSFNSGAGPVAAGDLAELHPVFPMGGTKFLAIDDRVAIVRSETDIRIWKVVVDVKQGVLMNWFVLQAE